MDQSLNASHHKLFRIGVLGIPSDWQELFAPALANLAQRVQVMAVYDALAETSRREAERLGASPTNGAIALARRTNVDALLVLNTGWQEHHLLTTIAQCGKPLFLRAPLPDSNTVVELQTAVEESRILCVPSLPHRFCPATTRVMELIATQLAEPLRLDVLVDEQPEQWHVARLAEIVDWMFFVLRTDSELHSIRMDQGGCRIRFRTATGRGTIDAFIRIARDNEQPGYTVKCQRGRATMLSATDVCWQLTGQREEIEEALQSDRTATETEIAIFCRRAAGGLVPTADLSDLLRARTIAEQIATAWF